ncbi:hypothetical protein LUZ60_017061 [Juncus effusus]|nr:hypothetical protein LUZ60_017061 [Juncus effusus]
MAYLNLQRSKSLFLLLLTLLLPYSALAQSFHMVELSSFVGDDICDESKDMEALGSDDSQLKIVHRHGPCSPLNPRETPSHDQILSADQSRVDSIHKRTSASSNREMAYYDSLDSSEIPARNGAPLGTGNYIVSIGVGTPKKSYSVVFDTGSDVTWIQCKPCVTHCYPQQDQLFDPSQSSTYANISCSSSYCDQLDTHGCSGSTCLYAVQYGDNSYTVGYYVQDTLTLTQTDVIPSFRFGCGENNDGLFGKAAGLLGLGRDTTSFVSQTFGKYHGVFSYCLPATTSSTGFLAFGCGSNPTKNVKFTPLLTNAAAPTFYYLNLIGISVGGKQLPVSSTVFSTAGTIIDSGTVITRLPPDAYSALSSAFKQAMSHYKTAPAFSILDTCYDLTGYSSVTTPTIALLFAGGTTMNLDSAGIMYANGISQVCLAFAGNDDPSDFAIIGNVQQRKLNVVYDVSKKLVGFGPGSC